jgi:hypothetical protein
MLLSSDGFAQWPGEGQLECIPAQAGAASGRPAGYLNKRFRACAPVRLIDFGVGSRLITRSAINHEDNDTISSTAQHGPGFSVGSDPARSVFL